MSKKPVVRRRNKSVRRKTSGLKRNSSKRVKNKEPQMILQVKGSSTIEKGPMFDITLGGSERKKGRPRASEKSSDLHLVIGRRTLSNHTA